MANGQLLDQSTVLLPQDRVDRLEVADVDVSREGAVRELKHDLVLGLKRSKTVAQVDTHGLLEDEGHLLEDEVGKLALEEDTRGLHRPTLHQAVLVEVE